MPEVYAINTPDTRLTDPIREFVKTGNQACRAETQGPGLSAPWHGKRRSRIAATVA